MSPSMTPFFNEIEDFFYNFMYEIESSFPEFRLFMTIYLAVIGVCILAVLIPNYLLTSIGYSTIAKRRGVKGYWLAWIPVAKNWVIGGIADEYDQRHLGCKRRFRVFLLLSAVVNVLSTIVLFAGLAAIIPLIGNTMDGNETEALKNAMQMSICLEYGIMGMAFSSGLFTAFYYISVYKIIESFTPKLAVLFFILSLFVGLFLPIWLVVMRKKGYPYPEEVEEIPEAVRIGWYED